jgi:hydroxyacylglutathione hydrolase
MTQGLYLRQLLLGPMKNFLYLVGPEAGDTCIVVDPAWDVPAIERAAEEDGRRIVGAFCSHCHGDHVNGLPELLSRHDIPVYAQREEIAFAPVFQQVAGALRPLGAGEVLPIEGARLVAIHTPGHTPGSQCLLANDALVSGDTVFINACGRCDLKGGDPEAMYRSLTQTLGALPGETRLYPGHDYAEPKISSLADERARNPYFQFRELDAFVRYRMQPR